MPDLAIGQPMTCVVTENFNRCEHTDRVEVCSVDCFHEGGTMLVIHPGECADRDVREPECPAEAIEPDTRHALEAWLAVNVDFPGQWPNTTREKDPPPDAKAWDGEAGKRDLLDPAPGAS